MTESDSQVSAGPQAYTNRPPVSRYRWLGTALCFTLLLVAGLDFGRIAWGTGQWVGQFSLKWGLAFAAFSLTCGLALLGMLVLLWAPQRASPAFKALIRLRAWLRWITYPLAILFVLLPSWFLLYTPWGEVFSSPALRLLLLLVTGLGTGYLLTRDNTRVVGWSPTTIGFLLVGATFVLAESLTIVRSYPFSLDWSDGNRMWDYSILYGRRLYDFPPDQEIFAFIDRGRQALWGLPFMLPCEYCYLVSVHK